jgi:hypothetical protein
MITAAVRLGARLGKRADLSGLMLQKLLTGRQKWEGYRIWIKTDFANFIRDTLLSPHARYVEFLESRRRIV